MPTRTMEDLLNLEPAELESLLGRFLDPGCQSDPAYAVLARELVHSPAFGEKARSVLIRAEKLGLMPSTAHALDVWRELTEALVSRFECCPPDAAVIEALMEGPYRPGLDRPLEWFATCCDRCYGRFIRAVKWQRLLGAESAFAAWNEKIEGGPLVEALLELEREESVRFTDQREGLAACRKAYELSKRAIPAGPGRLDDPRARICRSVHALAAARLMNAYRYTSDTAEARALLGEVEALTLLCEAYHLAEIQALVGVLKADLGDMEDGLELLRSAVEGFEIEDLHLSGMWMIVLAESGQDSSLGPSHSWLRKGVQCLEPRRDSDLHQIATINLARMLAESEKTDEAAKLLRNLEFSNPHFTAAGAFIDTIIDTRLGNWANAYQRICATIKQYSELGRSADVATSLLLRGEIRQEMGFFEESMQDFLSAVELFDALDLARFRTSSIRELRKAVEARNAAEASGLSRTLREQLGPLPRNI